MKSPYEKLLIEQLRIRGYIPKTYGMPDLVCEIEGKLYFIEIKGRKDRISPRQKEVFDLLKKHGFVVCICYSGSINEIYEYDPAGPDAGYKYCVAYYGYQKIRWKGATDWKPRKINLEELCLQKVHESIDQLNAVLTQERNQL